MAKFDNGEVPLIKDFYKSVTKAGQKSPGNELVDYAFDYYENTYHVASMLNGLKKIAEEGNVNNQLVNRLKDHNIHVVMLPQK